MAESCAGEAVMRPNQTVDEVIRMLVEALWRFVLEGITVTLSSPHQE